MQIRRIEIRDFRAIRELAADIAPAGVAAVGKNGSGKTSFLGALFAAVQAHDIAADAIRTGAEVAEIRIETDEGKIRRRISQKDSTVAITTADGLIRKSPQQYLDAMFGPLLDPLALHRASPREQRKLILQALPLRVSPEQLRAWAPDIPAGFDAGGHGLEVIARAHALYYERRTAANAAAKSARAEAERVAGLVPLTAPVATVSVGEALAEVQVASGACARLGGQVAEARRSAERSAGARKRIAELREEGTRARDLATQPHSTAIVDMAGQLIADAAACVEDLERQLAEARTALSRREESYTKFVAANLAAIEHGKRAVALESQAGDLEATIAAASVAEVPDADIEAANRRAENARAALAAAEAAAAYARLKADADRIAAIAEKAEADAKALDARVKFLADAAPRELMASSGGGLEGLTIEGDDVMLDGTRLPKLCCAERMFLSIDIAKRMRPKVKILAVDDLEHLDPEQLEAFVQHATADGWQLFGSRAAAGEFHLEAFTAEPSPAGAVK